MSRSDWIQLAIIIGAIVLFFCGIGTLAHYDVMALRERQAVCRARGGELIQVYGTTNYRCAALRDVAEK